LIARNYRSYREAAQDHDAPTQFLQTLIGPVPRAIWHPRNHAKIIVRSWWQSVAAIQV